MALTDLVFHAYLDVFSPKVSSFSFVDNLGFMAPDVGALAQGYNATLCFVELFELELDAAKTYVWAVDNQQRAQVAALGLPVVQHARDLGGMLSYGRAVRNSELRSRMQQLEPLWKRLRRSPSPCAYKLAILPLKFWPRALHAISGCPASQLDFKSLRTAAVRALAQCPAGSSPFLRLSLSLSMESDPEFYQLWTVLRDVRRLLAKDRRLLHLWRAFMSEYDGHWFHGPFSKSSFRFWHKLDGGSVSPPASWTIGVCSTAWFLS